MLLLLEDKTYSFIYGSNPPIFCVCNWSANWSLNQDLIPYWDMICIWSLCLPKPRKLITEPLLASEKNISDPHAVKLSGLKLIPYSSILAIWVPKTSGTEAIAPPPVESVITFLSDNT